MHMDWTPTTTRTIDLGYDQLLRFDGLPGTRVRVLYGSMWLTEEGDPRDIIANCGDEVTLFSEGLSVIEGIGAARVQVIGPSRPPLLAALRRRLAHVWRAVRARRPWREVFARSVLMGLAVVASIAVLHVAVPGPLAWHDAPVFAQSQGKPDRAAGIVLEALAGTGTGFLAVS
jgi:hypothetical protein